MSNEKAKVVTSGVIGGIIGYFLRRPKITSGALWIDRVEVEPKYPSWGGEVTLTVIVISELSEAELFDVACQVDNDILIQDVMIQPGENIVTFLYQTRPTQGVQERYNITAAILAAHNWFQTVGG